MSKVLALLFLMVMGLYGNPAYAAEGRSRAVTREFQRLHPCPSTGRKTGACFGWVKDHRIPICLGHEFDRVDNLTWQPYAESLEKDKLEREICRFYKDFVRSHGDP